MLKLSHALPSLLTDAAETKDSAFECLKTLMCFTLYQEGSLKAGCCHCPRSLTVSVTSPSEDYFTVLWPQGRAVWVVPSSSCTQQRLLLPPSRVSFFIEPGNNEQVWHSNSNWPWHKNSFSSRDCLLGSVCLLLSWDPGLFVYINHSSALLPHYSVLLNYERQMKRLFKHL